MNDDTMLDTLDANAIAPDLTGRVPDLPEAVYHGTRILQPIDITEPGVHPASHPGFSTSDLKRFYQCIAEYRAPGKMDSPAMKLGRAAHLATFDPDYDLERDYVAPPDVVGYKTAGSKSKPNATFNRLAAGDPNDKDLLKHDDIEGIAERVRGGAVLVMPSTIEEAKIIGEAVRKHPRVKEELINGGNSEVSYYGEWEGMKLRARLDFETKETESCVVDLKTARSGDPEKFLWQVRDLHYDWQDYSYQMIPRIAAGKKVRRFMFAVADKRVIMNCFRDGLNTAFGVMVCELGDEERKRAANEFNDALSIARGYLEDPDQWAGYSKNVVMLGRGI